MAGNIVQLRNVEKSFGGRQVIKGIDLAIRNGEFLTLLGPSGCGKTTLLRLISGFEQPDKGSITIQDKDVTEEPPQTRDVHTVFQSYALFPHLSVFENIAFGLRCKKMPKAIIEQKVRDALALIKLEELHARKPESLSGGQKQRVAIARAVVNEPLVLLLDEPLSALDYRLRKTMQIELKQLQRKLGITFIFVTHDQEEALSMSDRVVVMEDGHIAQIGTPQEVYEEPCSLTVGRFIGEVNQFDATVVEVQDETVVIQFNEQKLNIKQPEVPLDEVGAKIHVLIRPEDIRVWHYAHEPEVEPLLAGNIFEVIYKGSTVDLQIRLENGQLIIATQFFDEDNDEDLHYKIGEKVWLHWPSGWEVILPDETN